jgi:hypothetical protein
VKLWAAGEGIAVLAHGRGIDEAIAVVAAAVIVVGFVIASRRRNDEGDE